MTTGAVVIAGALVIGAARRLLFRPTSGDG
jgi:hypothetical protein